MTKRQFYYWLMFLQQEERWLYVLGGMDKNGDKTISAEELKNYYLSITEKLRKIVDERGLDEEVYQYHHNTYVKGTCKWLAAMGKDEKFTREGFIDFNCREVKEMKAEGYNGLTLEQSSMETYAT